LQLDEDEDEGVELDVAVESDEVDGVEQSETRACRVTKTSEWADALKSVSSPMTMLPKDESIVHR
jgi:hypothetical protein